MPMFTVVIEYPRKDSNVYQLIKCATNNGILLFTLHREGSSDTSCNMDELQRHEVYPVDEDRLKGVNNVHFL